MDQTMTHPTCLKLSLLFSFFLLSACSTVDMKVLKEPQPDDYPHKVAVLPFTCEKDISKKNRPNAILREVFYSRFAYLGYNDIPIEEIDRRLFKAGYQSWSDIKDLAILEIRETFPEAEAVVRGHVLEASNFTGGIYAETRIRAKLEMIDLRTGETLWETEHHEGDYTSILNPTVVGIVGGQIHNSNKEKAFNRLAHLFATKVMAKIPDPGKFRQKRVNVPQIDSISAEIPKIPHLQPYDIVKVQLKGEPGHSASFDLGNWKTGIDMVEDSPGHYTGAYQIKPGDTVDGGNIVATLVGSNGLSSKKVFQTSWELKPVVVSHPTEHESHNNRYQF